MLILKIYNFDYVIYELSLIGNPSIRNTGWLNLQVMHSMQGNSGYYTIQAAQCVTQTT